MAKGLAPREALAVAGRAFVEAQGGLARVSEQEKSFTSNLLAQLLTRPSCASIYTALAWRLGRGVGEYLLQQVDWILQVGLHGKLKMFIL